MLVVANQGAARVCRESSLAGAREAKEEGNIAGAALVGRRMEGEDVVLDGHLIKEDGEDALLHLACVLGAKDDHLALKEIDGDRSARSHALGVSVGWEGTGVVDSVVGVEVLKLVARGTDKHVLHEKGMVGACANDAHLDAVVFIPASVAINDVDAVSGVEVVDGAFAVDLPDLWT